MGSIWIPSVYVISIKVADTKHHFVQTCSAHHLYDGDYWCVCVCVFFLSALVRPANGLYCMLLD